MKSLDFAWLFVSVLAVGCTSTPQPTPAPTPAPTQPPRPMVRIHYLGHACFFLQFDNGLSVLTDYGQSKAYGLNSPIYDLDLKPDIVTFSHAHPDHKRPEAEFGQAKILTNNESLDLNGLAITPIPTSEASQKTSDNTSYLFTYKEFKILHLADAQAYVMAIEQEATKQTVKELYPDRYDILLMTIQGPSEFIPQAEKFLDLLQPVRVIPMHYWSPEYKTDFLAHLRTQNQQAGKHYTILTPDSANYVFYANDQARPIQIVSLTPAQLPENK